MNQNYDNDETEYYRTWSLVDVLAAKRDEAYTAYQESAKISCAALAAMLNGDDKMLDTAYEQAYNQSRILAELHTAACNAYDAAVAAV